MKFERYNLDDRINKALEDLRLIRATEIQRKAIPHIFRGEDLLGIAQTGTGKTAAFAIPLLQKMQTGKPKKGLKVLVMVPTRELAKQNAEAFKNIGKYTKFKATAIYGGVEQDPQIERLTKGTDILVATPGRMFDLKSQGYINFDDVETIVLDEADQMLDLGFVKDIEQLMRLLPRKRQTLFFSATIDKDIKKLAYSLISKGAIRIEIAPEDPISKNVEHCLAKVTMDEKRFYLEQVIKAHPESKIMVFVRTKVRAERVKAAMARVNLETDTIHGDKDQKERYTALTNFKKGINKVLISTDVAARGIDVRKVEYVVNYDIPDNPENYVHRIGRTGRGEEKGVAVSLSSPEEMEYIKQIEELIGKKIPVLEKNDVHYDNIQAEDENDWRSVMNEIEEFDQIVKKGKSRKGKGKRK